MKLKATCSENLFFALERFFSTSKSKTHLVWCSLSQNMSFSELLRLHLLHLRGRCNKAVTLVSLFADEEGWS